MDLNFTAKKVTTEHNTAYDLSVNIEGVDVEDVVSQLTPIEIVNNISTSLLLDAIGIEEVKSHFGLIEDSELA